MALGMDAQSLVEPRARRSPWEHRDIRVPMDPKIHFAPLFRLAKVRRRKGRLRKGRDGSRAWYCKRRGNQCPAHGYKEIAPKQE